MVASAGKSINFDRLRAAGRKIRNEDKGRSWLTRESGNRPEWAEDDPRSLAEVELLAGQGGLDPASLGSGHRSVTRAATPRGIAISGPSVARHGLGGQVWTSRASQSPESLEARKSPISTGLCDSGEFSTTIPPTYTSSKEQVGGATTTVQNRPEKPERRKPRIASAPWARQGDLRLLRFATALRVTSPHCYGSAERNLSARTRPEPLPFPRKQPSLRIGPQADQGAKRQSEPLTARTDLESSGGEGKGDIRTRAFGAPICSVSEPSRRDKYRR